MILASRKRLHLQGQPVSNSSLHSIIMCGLSLLYSVHLKKDILPFRDVFSSIQANSNTLYAYSQHFKAAETLFKLMEDLSSALFENISRPSPPAPVVEEAAFDAWQTTLSGAVGNSTDAQIDYTE